MYINDLNSSYVYESERRADEMRAAAADRLLPARAKNHSAKVMMVLLVVSILIWLVI